MAAVAATTVQLAERPLVEPLAAIAEQHRWGIVPRVAGPGWMRTAAILMLLDYTLYVWHVLVHRIPALWRFHSVHHIDRDLTASTALRFHFGELAISVPWRAMQVVLIGVSPAQLRLWQRALLVSILFHHSNLRLPRRLERAFALVVMTPRLHGIHHSDVDAIRSANWSSGLTLWDWLHGTLRNDVPQEAVTIGVEGCESSQDLSLARILTVPFKRDRR
jgi:sterol desaturase/sphingolipid hydroxylase (fatty acid hydroxylase superfamily)